MGRMILLRLVPSRMPGDSLRRTIERVEATANALHIVAATLHRWRRLRAAPPLERLCMRRLERTRRDMRALSMRHLLTRSYPLDLCVFFVTCHDLSATPAYWQHLLVEMLAGRMDDVLRARKLVFSLHGFLL